MSNPLLQFWMVICILIHCRLVEVILSLSCYWRLNVRGINGSVWTVSILDATSSAQLSFGSCSNNQPVKMENTRGHHALSWWRSTCLTAIMQKVTAQKMLWVITFTSHLTNLFNWLIGLHPANSTTLDLSQKSQGTNLKECFKIVCDTLIMFDYYG